ncbi:MAG: PocR ligand-binding domain-containing protein [Aminipila sp.]
MNLQNIYKQVDNLDLITVNSCTEDKINEDLEYNFTNLFDLSEIQRIQDAFSFSTGVASIITKVDGTPITKPSNFCSLCNIIQKTEKGLKNCMLSHSIIGKPKKDGPQIKKCFCGGLIDGGANIIVGDQHVANWHIGQILTSEYSIDDMLTYADEIGVERDIFINELNKVNQVSKQQFTDICNSLFSITQLLSNLAIKNIVQEREITKRKIAEEMNKSLEEKIQYLSYHDQLTGVYNRRFYQEELKRLDKRRNLPLSVVIGDINGLQLVNDTYGYEVGDELIKKVADIIKGSCRKTDFVARLGGDKFVILLPKTDTSETEKIIERIEGVALNEKVQSIDISISFGYETKHNENEKIHEIVKKAEQYMHSEKLFDNQNTKGNAINTIIDTFNKNNKGEELHSFRVASICEKMGMALSLPENQIMDLKTVGLLHDIGKIAIDENVLHNTKKLTDYEWKQIKRHSEIGYTIISTVIGMSHIAECVLFHHERWDGKGYPRGLKAEKIPLMSRIVAIIDAYDAMTSERSYRRALPMKVALEELKHNAGTQFDSKLVSVFIEKVLEISV